MDSTEALHRIAAEAASGDLVFPTSAKLALKAKQMLDNPRCHIETATRLVEAEPLLAARAVALANSVAYNRGGREITDVRTAIGRIGFNTLRMLAAALVTRQMAGILAQPEHHAVATRLWEHTAHVAAVARVVARRVDGQDPETAMFAGIVHEVGSFYLLSRAADFPELAELSSATWDAASESEIGGAVLAALGVPETVSAAVAALWQGRLALPPQTLGDVLLLADDLATVASPLHPPRAPEADAPAVTLDTLIGGEPLYTILQDSAEEVEALTGALRF